MGEGSKDFWRVLIAFFVPPAGVFLQVGMGLHFWLNLVLLIFFWVPAQIHAVWVISTIGPGGREEPNGMQTFVSLLLAALLPPIGVFMKKGLGMAFVINCVLCIFFWFPASIHALWVITADE